MKIDNHVLELIDRVDSLQKKLDNERSPKVTQSQPDAIETSDADRERKGSVNHFVNNERRRIARLAGRDPQAAKQQSKDLEASMQKSRPMTQVELVHSLQETRAALALARQAADETRITAAQIRLRALHRERTRRGSIRVAC